MIEMAETKPCPFCGADADLKWIVNERGKAVRVRCGREGECPSPEWSEDAADHEDDAECVESVVSFWNTRAEDWSPLEMIRLRKRLVMLSNEISAIRYERDMAVKALAQIAANTDAPDMDAGQ